MSMMDVDLPTEPELLMSAVKDMKNAVIGNRNHKEKFVQGHVLLKLVNLISNEDVDVELKTEAVVIFGSLSKGPEHVVQCVYDSGILPLLIRDVQHTNMKYADACLRCLRTVVCRRSSVCIDVIFSAPCLIPYLINVIHRSLCTKECVATIISNCCLTKEHQAVLCASGAISSLTAVLSASTGNETVQLPVLRCIAVMCYKNPTVSSEVVKANYNNDSVVSLLSRLVTRSHSTELQMAAAKCLTYLCRAGVIDAGDHVIVYKTLPTLVRQCKSDRKWEERVDAAETLAYLIEVDVSLQNTAAISEQIISTLADYFKYPGSPPDLTLMPTTKDDITVGNELRQAAFHVYAALCANNEDVRKQIVEMKSLMGHIVNGLSDLVPKVQVAAIKSLHSLSRSVRQLRTSFQDYEVWKPVRPILLNTSDETQLLAVTSIACNLLLEFSPCKEHMLQDAQAMVDRLVELTRHSNPGIRLNSVWALMNLTFNADQKLRSQVLCALGSDDLFRLLMDSEVDVVMKMIGLLRNLLSSRSYVDTIMSEGRLPVIGAVIMTLEAGRPTIVKEQALCILANIANGKSAKDYIMGNDDLVGKIVGYLQHSSVCLQLAATHCITNLLDRSDDGATCRQQKLRDMGVDKQFQSLLTCSDQTVSEAVKKALERF